ncbi:aconitase family protein [Acetomicrobium sp.]|uniref:aconitase family protein n=1 Tax=Acetomicrobium sp. TaxID=1872099 RepID=UPI003075BAC1
MCGIEQAEGIPISQVFIGTCTGGRLNDIKIASEILKGKHVAKNVRCIVIPASKKIFRKPSNVVMSKPS